MQTRIAEPIRDTPAAIEADKILRSCVHCGFCNATCPTYQLLGDELDGPRGRIYLIKQMFEGADVSKKTQLHLDRCLTCRSCETTCPSGVQYGRLVEIGRHEVNQRVRRPFFARLQRRFFRWILPYPRRFAPLMALVRGLGRIVPEPLRLGKLDPAAQSSVWPAPLHVRKMLILDGCVQSRLAPSINAATARLLDRLGVSVVQAIDAGCCGAVSQHLDAADEAAQFMRHNIDQWWPYIDPANRTEPAVEALITTASACGLMVKDYGHLLRNDPDYAQKAAHLSSITRDIGEVLIQEGLSKLGLVETGQRIAFHAPCTLQHGQSVQQSVETLLRGVGFELTQVRDQHLCCGAAGTYSLLQPELSQQLLQNKLTCLTADAPAVIVTANIGCLTHLQNGASIPVRHWVEELEAALT